MKKSPKRARQNRSAEAAAQQDRTIQPDQGPSAAISAVLKLEIAVYEALGLISILASDSIRSRIEALGDNPLTSANAAAAGIVQLQIKTEDSLLAAFRAVHIASRASEGHGRAAA
jgi:hypothetical protein